VHGVWRRWGGNATVILLWARLILGTALVNIQYPALGFLFSGWALLQRCDDRINKFRVIALHLVVFLLGYPRKAGHSIMSVT
jgi:hypothetical protein